MAGSELGPAEKQLSQIPLGDTVLSAADAPVQAKLSVPEKVALFRSLFRGREDVYALRWEEGRRRVWLFPCKYPRLERL